MRLAESSGLVSVPTRPRRRRKALVVDDDASARFMLKSLLTRSGYDVSIATNGRDALEMFRSNPSDIVFMDLYMPHMDGLESAHQIKALSVREFVPVIFVSGAADTQDLVRGIEAGGDDFLTKPYDELVLKAKIRALERIRTLHRNSARLHERARADWEVAQSLLAEVVMGGNPQTSALLLDLTPTDAFSADVALAVTGYAGAAPDGQEDGLVYFACMRRGGPLRRHVSRFGAIGRGPVRIGSVRVALQMMREAVDQP